jgi:hypothetical protein
MFLIFFLYRLDKCTTLSNNFNQSITIDDSADYEDEDTRLSMLKFDIFRYFILIYIFF